MKSLPKTEDSLPSMIRMETKFGKHRLGEEMLLSRRRKLAEVRLRDPSKLYINSSTPNLTIYERLFFSRRKALYLVIIQNLCNSPI